MVDGWTPEERAAFLRELGGKDAEAFAVSTAEPTAEGERGGAPGGAEPEATADPSGFPCTNQELSKEASRHSARRCRDRCGVCPSPRAFYHSQLRRWSLGPCRTRKCRWCGVHIWKPRTLAKFGAGTFSTDLEAGTKHVPLDALKVTLLTPPGEDELLDQWRETFPQHAETWPEDTHRASAMKWFNDTAPSRFDHFKTLLVQRTGVKWQHAKVAEFQDRGLTHYQGLLRSPDLAFHWIDMETFRDCAVRAGFGRYVGLRRVDPTKGGVTGILSYLGKTMVDATAPLRTYLGKTLTAWEWQRQHVFTTSHGWAIGWRRPGKRSRVEVAVQADGQVVAERPVSPWRWRPFAEWADEGYPPAIGRPWKCGEDFVLWLYDRNGAILAGTSPPP